MVEFQALRFLNAPAGRVQSDFLATPLGAQKAMLIYLHGHGERAERNAAGRNALRGNNRLIPNILENDDPTAQYVGDNFVVVVPQAFLDKDEWDSQGLWASIKSFYGPHVGADLSARLFITGVSMGGRGTWSLAGEVLRDQPSPFRLEAIAAIDVYKHIDPSMELRRVRALGMRTPHIANDATERALDAIGQRHHFIDRTQPPKRPPDRKAHFSEAWASLYGETDFYAWLLDPAAPLPRVHWE